MRLWKGLASGLIAVGLAGCSGGGGGSPQPPAGGGMTGVITSTAPAAAPASPQMRARARAAAVQFYGLYSASQFSAFWNLLAPGTKRQIPRHLWISVHSACPSAGAGKSRVIKAVTVFGNAAIITESIAGASPATTEDVFSYANGKWSYSPVDPSIYDHGSVGADVAAAKAAGFCTGWKIF
jgi:hypothetical protein